MHYNFELPGKVEVEFNGATEQQRARVVNSLKILVVDESTIQFDGQTNRVQATLAGDVLPTRAALFLENCLTAQSE